MNTQKTTILGGKLLLAALVIFIYQKFNIPTIPARELANGGATAEKKPALAMPRTAGGAAQQSPTAAATTPLLAVDPSLTKEAILTRIHDASVTYDPNELPKIRVFLDHEDAEVRRAALDGMTNLGDSSAGAMFREASKKARTPQEAVALEEAANYIELPPSKTFKLRKKASP